MPLAIQNEMAASPKGVATVVFFTDFQCPYCRRTHGALAPILAAKKERVRLVIRQVPLHSHPDARTAAKADVCGEKMGLGHAYTEALFNASDLSESSCEALAVQRGVDRDAFRRCIAEPDTNARIERDLAEFDAVNGDGVPLLFVGHSRLEGEQDGSGLEAAITKALDVGN